MKFSFKEVIKGLEVVTLWQKPHKQPSARLSFGRDHRLLPGCVLTRRGRPGQENPAAGRES